MYVFFLKFGELNTKVQSLTEQVAEQSDIIGDHTKELEIAAGQWRVLFGGGVGHMSGGCSGRGIGHLSACRGGDATCADATALLPVMFTLDSR